MPTACVYALCHVRRRLITLHHRLTHVVGVRVLHQMYVWAMILAVAQAPGGYEVRWHGVRGVVRGVWPRLMGPCAARQAWEGRLPLSTLLTPPEALELVDRLLAAGLLEIRECGRADERNWAPVWSLYPAPHVLLAMASG
jgi:hypothetical protein